MGGIEVLPFDFQLATSKDEAAVIASCRDILATGDAGEARNLWDALVALAKSKRHPGGELNAQALIAHMRTRFSLKGHPDYRASWTALRSLCTERMARVEMALPSGIVVDRQAEQGKLVASLERSRLTVAHGDSGVGKSALVRASLRSRFDAEGIVWLRADDLERVLDQAQRLALGLSLPLPDILEATPRSENVLVIDSAERLTEDGVKFVEALIERLCRVDAATRSLWRVALVTQSYAVDRFASLQAFLASGKDIVEVGAIDSESVRKVLRSYRALFWLSADDDAVEVLRNLKTLAWVCQAEESFIAQPGAGVSRVSVAERLWQHWTNGRPLLQSIMMTMAEREASFAPVLTRSNLDSAQLKELNELPQSCPVVFERGRLEFRHDLAADWSRYQCLRELGDRPLEWAAYASNPLWHSAIRMLGQELLRQPSGVKTAWDSAFDELEKSKTLRGAAGLLLDALCLDPLAERWMQERIDLLLDNNGKRLAWMLERFHHNATVPTVSAQDGDNDLGFYMEAMFRTPIYGRWGPVVHFLHRNIARIAPLGSSDVARICETWLKSTPALLSGKPTYYRAELAELALASAREVQFELIKDHMGYDKGEEAIYAAAFAATPDLPNDVGAWALEMARRRPLREDIRARKKLHDRNKAILHAERMKSDAAYRERNTRKRSIPSFAFLEPRKLPPWPDGAKGRIPNEFKRSCCHRGVLTSLMQIRPEIAAEVLLAVIIDDAPTEERSDGLDRGYGLAYDGDSDAVIYWKSAFYSFFRINPAIALRTLVRLINFCCERWRDSLAKRTDRPHPHIVVSLADGSQKRLYGNRDVAAWSYQQNMRMGQLRAAFHALERWLWERCEAGQDIGDTVDALIEQCNSAAFVPVLVNVGKAYPELFSGWMSQLLAIPEVHFWEHHERQALPFRFDQFSWCRSGEAPFQAARQWDLAPFRSRVLRDISLERQRSDGAFAGRVHASLQSWIADNPQIDNDEREFLAALDCKNYDRKADGTFVFKAPANPDETAQEAPSIANQLRSAEALGNYILQADGGLADDDAVKLTELIDAIEQSDELTAGEKRIHTTALASALAVKAEAWLEANSIWRERCVALLHEALDDEDSSPVHGRRMRLGGNPALEYAGPALVIRWLRAPDNLERGRLLVRFMLSLNEGAVGLVIGTALQYRQRVGSQWERLLQIATLWSALLALRPRYGDDETDSRLWNSWHDRLRRFDVRRPVEEFKPQLAALAKRVERIHQLRFRKANADNPERQAAAESRHLSWGLDTLVLTESFSWALNWPRESDVKLDQSSCVAVLAVWEFETWRIFDGDDDRRRDRLPCQLGYNALDTLGGAAAQQKSDDAHQYWYPVLSLGAKAEASIRHFCNAFFARFTDSAAAAQVAVTWRCMLEFVLADEELTTERRWYDGEKVLRHVMGFGNEVMIARLQGSTQIVASMRDLYAAWAARHLAHDDDNVTAYAYFLMRPVASELRIEGVQQIAKAMASGADRYLNRRDRVGSTLVELIEKVLQEKVPDNAELRSAILSITDVLVTHRVPTALALQDRIRRIRN
ncbi:MAG: ATP-binding protein [Hyphomicrobiaceae bacterium]|nr:ATP-binding protein [Hyphomicrobiaceae bacterium]